MKNYERIKNMTVEEMAEEIKLIANWDRKQKKIAEQDENFYVNWLNAESKFDDKCRQTDSDYCKNECPLGQSKLEI
jgi:hypothetical protein